MSKPPPPPCVPLGVTLEGAREASEEMLSGALASIGISLEEVRREAGEAFDMRVPDNRRIPFSPTAKNALVEARKRMRRMGDNYLGTEHVLLGILDNEDGAAVRMLARTGGSRRDAGGPALRVSRPGHRLATVVASPEDGRKQIAVIGRPGR